MLEIVAQCARVVEGNAEALGSSAPGAVPEVAAPLLVHGNSPAPWLCALRSLVAGLFPCARALRFAQLRQGRLRGRTSGTAPGADDHARRNFSFPSQGGGRKDGYALRAP